jgi:hypothetical protein
VLPVRSPCAAARGSVIGCTFYQRERSTYRRASINCFACLTASSFTL